MELAHTLALGMQSIHNGANLNLINFVQIGDIWVSDKNLSIEKTVLGTVIPYAGANGINYTDAEFYALTTPAWRYYNNDPANKGLGKLYNYYALELIQSDIATYNLTHPLAPINYEVISRADWLTLIATAGGTTLAGGKFKQTGLINWNTPNTGATDDYKYGIIGSGMCGTNGVFSGLKTLADIWTATQIDVANAYMVRCANDNANAAINPVSKKRGLSIRLKKKISAMMIGDLPNVDVIKIALYGDSIFASGFADNTFPDEYGLSRYEQPFRTGQLKGFTKYIYDYLDFNKPKFRSVKHTDWQYSGSYSLIDSHVMPNVSEAVYSSQWDALLSMNSVIGNTASIDVTDCDKMFLVFEGGTIGDATQTGSVNITVSVNGGAFINPSTILQGKKNGASYDAAVDTYDTAFTNPETLNAYNKYQALREVIYNGLVTTNTYTFKITRAGTEPNVYLLGCYRSIGQTLLVIDQSKPGFAWSNLTNNVYPDLVDSGVNYAILQAPMYHDSSLASAESAGITLINKIKSAGIGLTLCSCPPGGVVVTGSPSAILGDENSSSYMPSQNFVKYFNGLRIFTTTDLATASEAPKWGDIYRIVIGGANYDMTGNTSTGSLSATSVRLTSNSDFPIKSAITFPLTLTKISGNPDSKETIIVTGVNDYYSMSEHRNKMAILARTLDCQFVDTYQSFVDIANSAGESIDQDGYNMPINHPLYAYASSFIGQPGYDNLSLPLKMNYMSNFFNIGDGHHLSNAAHDIIFTKLRDAIFQNSPLI